METQDHINICWHQLATVCWPWVSVIGGASILLDCRQPHKSTTASIYIFQALPIFKEELCFSLWGYVQCNIQHRTGTIWPVQVVIYQYSNIIESALLTSWTALHTCVHIFVSRKHRFIIVTWFQRVLLLLSPISDHTCRGSIHVTATANSPESVFSMDTHACSHSNHELARGSLLCQNSLHVACHQPSTALLKQPLPLSTIWEQSVCLVHHRS